MGIEHYSLHTESLSLTGHEAMGRLSHDTGQHLTTQKGKTQTRIDRLKKKESSRHNRKKKKNITDVGVYHIHCSC
jgi:hypothetical protein